MGNPIEIIYERDFFPSMYCYTTIQTNDDLDNFTAFNNAEYIKKKFNLEKIYKSLKEKPSFCGRNLMGTLDKK